MRGIKINNLEGNKMKTMNALAITLAIFVTACSTSSVIYDDVYYSRAEPADGGQIDVATAPGQTFTASAVSSNTDYDYQTYQQEDVAVPTQQTASEAYQKTETVTEPDGTTYTTTETYYDTEYGNRIRRFHSGNTSFDYYDGYHTGCYDCGHMNYGYPRLSYNWGWSNYYGYGYPYYHRPWRSWYYNPYAYYDPFYYMSWSGYYGWGYGNYWHGYNMGYMHGYYAGYYGGYYGDAHTTGRSSRYYGPRGNYGGGTTTANAGPRGDRPGLTESGSPRGVRTSDQARGSVATAAERGTVDGTRTQDRSGRTTTAAERPQERMQRPANRPTATERQTTSTERQDVRTTETRQQTRPSASERVSEYRQRYERPDAAATRQQTREQRYERPQNYTAPNVRQPKSSSEYVRPQRVEPNRQQQSGSDRSGEVRQTTRSTGQQPTASPQRTTVRSQSTPSRSNVRSQPSRTPSRSSTPTRTVTTPSRSSSPAVSTPSRSSSSGSSGSSRGSSSSSSSSSSSNRGGRR